MARQQETEVKPEPERLLDLGAFGLGTGLAIWKIHIDDLKEQSLNARVMSAPMFERLAQTIGNDKRLESLPFAALIDGGFQIVSGHHRTRAARAGDVRVIPVLVDETGMGADYVKAKQLAHNAVSGEDEAQLVLRIFEQIQDVDAKLESFIDPSIFGARTPAAKLPNMDLELGYRSVNLVFLPGQADAFDKAIEQAIEDNALDKDSAIALVDIALFEQWQAACRRFRKEYDARALSTAVSKMVDAAAAHMGIEGRHPEDLDPQRWVPLADLFKSALVPPETAGRIKRAVAKLTDSGQVAKKTPWMAIDMWAREFLGE